MSKNDNRGWLEWTLDELGQVAVLVAVADIGGLIFDVPRSWTGVGVTITLAAGCLIGSVVLSVMRGRRS